MKLIFFLVTFLFGFGSGWIVISQQDGRSLTEKKRPEVVKVVDELRTMFATMSSAEIAEVMNQIRIASETSVVELDQMILWQGVAAYEMLEAANEGGAAGTRTYALERIESFRKAHEAGFNAGAWQDLADKVYEETGKPGETTTPEIIEIP